MDQSQKQSPYGFYCPQTKMFYSVPNEEVYKELMNMMRQGAFSKEIPASPSSSHSKPEVDLNRHYSEMMDQDIEDIYSDPIFAKELGNLELREYDFWYFSVYLFPFLDISLNVLNLLKTSMLQNRTLLKDKRVPCQPKIRQNCDFFKKKNADFVDINRKIGCQNPW